MSTTHKWIKTPHRLNPFFSPLKSNSDAQHGRSARYNLHSLQGELYYSALALPCTYMALPGPFSHLHVYPKPWESTLCNLSFQTRRNKPSYGCEASGIQHLRTCQFLLRNSNAEQWDAGKEGGTLIIKTRSKYDLCWFNTKEEELKQAG